MRQKTHGGLGHIDPYHKYKHGIITLNVTMHIYHVNLSYRKKSVYINSSNSDVHTKIKNMFNNGNILIEIFMLTRSENCPFFGSLSQSGIDHCTPFKYAHISLTIPKIISLNIYLHDCLCFFRVEAGSVFSAELGI